MGSVSVGEDVYVSRDDYLEILGFTIYVYLTGRIEKYSGIMRGKRALGEFIENFIYGKIAEVAFREFLRNKCGLEVLTDIDVADFIFGEYLPDIIAIKRNNDYETANFWIEVKEVRRDQRWLLVPASAIRARPYDAYVAVWVGLPDEHLAWIIRNVPEAEAKMSEDWRKWLAEVENAVTNIPCKIIGYVTWNDVKLVKRAEQGDRSTEKELNGKYGSKGWHYFRGSEKLFDPDDRSWSGTEVRENIGFVLRRMWKVADWNELYQLILQNSRLVEEQIGTKGKLPQICKHLTDRDYRENSFKCLNHQLSLIREKKGTIKRTKSWFEYPLFQGLK
ncbi:hypothetical protein [Infirmifilum sp.]|uniref:hypothetical protein n=1 Tax=Infirmifilum sp. TaxID=2856575 RepID=UPI003D101DB2